jgi:beta-aspartyl-peptidase (threonine type)
VRHPVSLARLVMEKTRHVLLVGDGAEKFADGQNIERVPNDWFDTDQRRKQLDEALKERASKGLSAAATAAAAAAAGPDAPPSDRRLDYGTVGCVALDAQGRLVAATSTGGMTAKRWGRVGDAPVIGAGNYADRFVAVSCTGTGEQFLRHVVAKSISARVEFGGTSLDEAVRALVDRTLEPGDGGVIAVDRFGNLVARFNSEGMYRGLADASGRFEVGIF